MHRLIYHVASGEVFFTGAGLLLLAALFSASRHPKLARLAPLTGIVAAIAVAISSAPLSIWFYIPAVLVTVIWLTVAWGNNPPTSRRRVVAGLLVVAVFVGVVLELPYHFSPTIDAKSVSAVTIFGDSLAAGVGSDADQTWPSILARKLAGPVHDHSQMGATTSTALKIAQQEDIPDGIVLIEIGGNDLLGSTSAAKFAVDLEALLKYLQAPGRQIILFELPLPPFANGYGHAQRRLAAKYGATLIPKRILAGVLAASDATLDTIHLTATGHDRLARQIQAILSRDAQ